MGSSARGARSCPSSPKTSRSPMRPQPGQDGTCCVDLVAERGLHVGVRRQVDVHARAEADESVALSPLQPVSLVNIAENAARDQTGDLHAGDVLPAGGLQPQRVAL